MLSRFVLLAPMALLAACSDHNPLPATQNMQIARTCRPEPSDWTTHAEVVFGDVLNIRAVTDSAISMDDATVELHDDLARCRGVKPALEVDLAVTRSTSPDFQGQTLAVRLGPGIPMNPTPTLNADGQLTWDFLGDPESAGEPLAVGRQLGMRLFARHPDGFWIASIGLFTENDEVIEFQSESGEPCFSLRYSSEPVSSASFWEAITVARTVPSAEDQAYINDVAAGPPSDVWGIWSSGCIDPR